MELDGQRLGDPVRRSPAAEEAANPADVSENTWLVWPLVPAQVGKGVHVVGIDLRERGPASATASRGAKRGDPR